ncbi:TLD-domain-containing protein [Hyaloraphidium curvatum]|nr:TLD-domain-containing protein [Hyaloraphidium curvatum]
MNDHPRPPSAPARWGLTSMLWDFFAGPPAPLGGMPDAPLDAAAPQLSVSPAVPPAAPDAGLEPVARRASLLDVALDFLGSFVDPSHGDAGEDVDGAGDAVVSDLDPNGWPTSFASLSDAEPESPASPASPPSASPPTAPPASPPKEPARALTREEEEALKLEEEMNAVVEHMAEEDQAAWELIEKEDLKRKAREGSDYYKQKFREHAAPKRIGAPAQELSQEDAEADARSKKELMQILLNTLPPLQLVGRRPDVEAVIQVSLAEELRKHLPLIHREARKWTLIYSLEQHGISLSTLYRLSADYEGPIVLGIRNTMGETFGAFLTETLIPRERYYGTGECFLWKAQQKQAPWDLKIFRATGKNEFMIHTEASFLSFGGGDGVFGLWLDNQLYHGHSEPSRSFENETLCSKRDFLIVGVELWGFGL